MVDFLPVQTRREVLLEFANVLRENPHDWQELPRPEGASQREGALAAVATRINTGHHKSFPKDEFQAKFRGGKVWVRCLGANAEKVPA